MFRWAYWLLCQVACSNYSKSVRETLGQMVGGKRRRNDNASYRPSPPGSQSDVWGQITCNLYFMCVPDPCSRWFVCVDVYRNIYAVDGVVNKAHYVVHFGEPWLSELMCMWLQKMENTMLSHTHTSPARYFTFSALTAELWFPQQKEMAGE